MYVQPENGLMSTFDYTYVIFTCNQRRTIQLMQSLQQAAKEASPNNGLEGSTDTILVENDDSAITKAVGHALSRDDFSDDILHYQILHQTWQLPGESDARRSIVLTNNEVFLFHETYAGDILAWAMDMDTSNVCFGDISMRTIASADIENVTDSSIAKEDPKLVTLTIKSRSRLGWSSSWTLRCRDSENAERLVEDVRKAQKAAIQM
eukprot:CAMPEP_0197239214 /NCGR_PEP_ID=MMETSP1429-20130617/5717_1 /TAXON_ID=49237 /ORGANISM="Chaetoceros  sp., Strain UNC1202" /LENGTH=206 /DNA_ID=CAMNT_0042698595 /DNA_START=175 /DNA_END=795 /DNA_ORIENTATION=+